MMCSKRDSNSHGHFCPKDFKSFVSTIPPFERPRAENETRTRDPNLGKVVLYQLSYFRIIFLHLLSNAVQRYNFFLNYQIFERKMCFNDGQTT